MVALGEAGGSPSAPYANGATPLNNSQAHTEKARRTSKLFGIPIASDKATTEDGTCRRKYGVTTVLKLAGCGKGISCGRTPRPGDSRAAGVLVTQTSAQAQTLATSSANFGPSITCCI